MGFLSWPTVAATALTVGLLSASPADAQSGCEKNWSEFAVNQDGLNLLGRLDEEDVRLYLHTGYPAASIEDGVSGVVLYPGRWLPSDDQTGAFRLDGAFTNDCQIQLKDSDSGIWQLKLGPGQHVTVTREYPAGAFATVSFQKTSEVDCSGRGAWRTFTSPAWPITFEYPASWRFVESGDQVVLGCPNPRSLAWGGRDIWIEHGQTREFGVADDGRKVARIDSFITFDDIQWSSEECHIDLPPYGRSVFCTAVRQSQRRGMTVLQRTAASRGYRAGGGYVGYGTDTRYAFLIDDAWVTLTGPDESLTDDDRPGPVIFDGDDVGARLVRSIRRRSP